MCIEERSIGPTHRYLKLYSSQSLMNAYCALRSKSERSNEKQRYYFTPFSLIFITATSDKKGRGGGERKQKEKSLCPKIRD